MAMAIGDIIEFSILWEYFSDKYMNVLHFRKTTAQTVPTDVPTELDQINTKFLAGGAGSLFTSVRAVVAQNVTMGFVRSQQIWPLRSVAEQANVGVPGAVGNDTATGNIAATITKRTQNAGRKMVGSFHTPGLPDGTYINGVIQRPSAFYTALLDLGDALEANIVTTQGGVYEPVLFHRNDQPPTATRLFSTIVQDTVRTMRRRTVGVGQ